MLNLGKYRISSIECGTLALDGGAMFGVVPKILWNRTNPSDEKNRITLAMRAMLIQGEGKNILVDCGAGEKLNEKIKDIYAIDYSQSSLVSSLSKAGLATSDITDVILTHLHFDHTGGATTSKEGKIVPTFPNAKYYVHKTQWETALDPTPRDKASYFKENYGVLDENARLVLISEQGELFPGIEIITVDGHTPGMVLVKVKDSDHIVLYCADLIPTASHIPIPYTMAYDLEPLKTMEEKETILAESVNMEWILFFEHDPFRAATTVRKTEKGYAVNKEVEI